VTDAPRRFGRALRLSARKRRMERLYDLVYAGGWPSWLARPLGLQGRLHLTRHEVTVAAPGPPIPPLRVAFASDLHGGPGTHPATIRRACRLLADWKPQLLLLGGDFVSFHARHVDGVLEAIDAIDAPLGKLAVLGNHDLIADDAYLVQRLSSIGVRTLVNENVRLGPPYERLWVCGLDNTEQGTPDGARALAGANGLRLILMHSPDGLTALGGESFAAAFTGHVHGGQFVLPGGKSLISSKGPLSQKYLYGGLFELGAPGERILLVSRGIGQGSLPMRFRADPEVHVCTLSFRD
jgi:predicted MPP superfamily phosphohydrolase